MNLLKKFSSLLAMFVLTCLLASCSIFNHVIPIGNDMAVAQERTTKVIDAINHDDIVGLKNMFSQYAIENYSPQIDEGLTFLLSLFSGRDVVLKHDPNQLPSSDSLTDGGYANLVNSSNFVTAGGHEYWLTFREFTQNSINPDNVGLYLLGAVPWTPDHDSPQELAFGDWASAADVDLKLSGPPGVFVSGDASLTTSRMRQIVKALNAHDDMRLEAMFTARARAENSPQIRDGIRYLFSVFPKGSISWKESDGGSAIYRKIQGQQSAVLLPTFYLVKSQGKNYRFFFADFTQNTFDSQSRGIYAIGVAAKAETVLDDPEAELYGWALKFGVDGSVPASIYVPS